MALLHVLGDGATVEMADRAIEFFGTSAPVGSLLITDIGGLAEVAKLLGRRPQTVQNWVTRPGFNVPTVVRKLAATSVYDLSQWREWAKGNPDLVDVSRVILRRGE